MEAILFIGLLIVICGFAIMSQTHGERPKPKTPPVDVGKASGAESNAAKVPSSDGVAWDPKHGHRDIPLPTNRVIKGKAHVIDGDTLKIGATKIRLAGVDAPELDMPYGQKSKWGMVNLCKGQVVTVELTGEQSHDRLVGTCFLPDGRDLGAELIKQGLALDYPKYSDGKYKHLEPQGARRKLKWVYIKERQQSRA